MLQTGSVLYVALALMKTQPLKQDLYPSCAAEQSRARKKMKNEKKQNNKSDRTAKPKAQRRNPGENWGEREQSERKEKEGMIHAAREVRAVLRYLHAASSEYAMHCENKKEQKDRV